MDLIPKIRGYYWKSISNRAYLSNDLGAIARLCFEIETQKMLIGKDEYLNE
jgi:type II restriction enzyme